MLYAITSIGSLVFLGSIVWLVLCFKKKKQKRNAIITLLVSFVLVGVLTPRDNNTDIQDDPTAAKSSDVSSGGDIASLSSSDDTQGSVKSGEYTLPCGLELSFRDNVRNDKTGNWRYSSTSDSINVADYAIEYYNELFSSDDEVHAVWNATLGTMTRISAYGNLLFVDTLDYVDGEEQDASTLFSGDLLDSKIIDLTTGEPFEATPSNEESSAGETDPASSNQSAEPLNLEDTARDFLAEEFELTLTEFRKSEAGFEATVSASGVSDRSSQDKAPSNWTEVQQRLLSAQSTLSGELGSPELGASLYLRDSGNGLMLTARNGEIVYDKYKEKATSPADTGSSNKSGKEEENQIQKEEISYVLNTNTMKFHKPGCTSVGDIAPENYSTYSGTRDGAISSGYDPCGRCHP